ncbi:N-acetylmuramoyl-L-alanine amidase [Sporomusaceae bacterium BoRhaA]|uniref:N-acetylmuramoyl-L-alanine amidase family protein n=1 Tax=Pelorhabdus rhamnosifermentans TaxID=2772457 RepID=UPI001C05FC38|nr:N-acetylmuramoyl-L-alanine amidase [Pelorhabdus rhamnosifermentans]MBU2702926.1 N-acetylmuramoyl-L-alanine amidase [Pelorhabdus rhamnosifermentans]
MRRKFFVLFMIAMMLLPQVALAAAYRDMGIVKTSAISAVKGQASLTNIRWANHIDAASGATTLRMVIDMTGPVQVDGSLLASPSPQLIVNIKNANASKVDDVLLDGKVASKINVSSATGNAKVVIDLPNSISRSDYHVFTLPSDSKNNKPYRVVVDINKPVLSSNVHYSAGLSDKVIVLDPGHGGSDPGAIGPGKDQEKTVTLAVAQKVKSLLEKSGATVLMTRQTDVDVYGPNASGADELGARADVANHRKTDVFLSIHANSFGNPTVGGGATYYYPKSNADSLLAQSIQDAYIQATGLSDRGIYQANFYVLKHTSMPASLIELAFISNPAEEKMLMDDAFQQKMAQGIVQGLDSFFTQVAAGGGDHS